MRRSFRYQARLYEQDARTGVGVLAGTRMRAQPIGRGSKCNFVEIHPPPIFPISPVDIWSDIWFCSLLLCSGVGWMPPIRDSFSRGGWREPRSGR